MSKATTLRNGGENITLTRRLLTTRISEETGLDRVQIAGIVQKTLDYISETLATGGRVEFRDFGIFEVKTRKARVGRDPKKPKVDVPIPARATVKFRAGRQLRAEVLKLPSA